MKPSRILIVDDQHTLLLTYTMILRQQGHVVAGVPTYAAALEHLQQGSYDLVVCDFGLEGGRTGFDVIEAAQEKHPSIASVLLTGYASPDIVEQADQRGIMVLHKPVEIPQLLQTLANIVGARGAA